MKNKLLFFCLLLCATLYAQEERQLLTGRVLIESEQAGIPYVFVINTTTGAETKTDAAGNFNIAVKEEDRLVVYGTEVKVRTFMVQKEWLGQKLVTLSVEYEGGQLEEVIINGTLSAESLGIVPKGQKRNTQMERKMYATGDFKALDLLKIIGGGMPFDPLINKISGRTAQVKKELATERKSAAFTKIQSVLSNKAFAEELKIPEGYTEGFIYYAVEDKDVAAALAAKNDEMLKFHLVGLAAKYRALIKEEKP